MKKDNQGEAGNNNQPTRKKNIPARRWVWIAILAVILVLLSITFLNVGNFLMVNEEPVKSDVIIVLAGDEGGRTDYGITLFEEGYSDKLLLTGCIESTDKMVQQAIAAGLTENEIIIEDQSVSTYENALNSKQLLLEAGYQSAIVVTSDYHMKRSSLVFNKAFKDTDISLTYCSLNQDGFTPEKWWSNSYSFKLVFSECIKIVGYFVQGKL